MRSLEVARAVNQSKHLRLVGVAGYEGLMPGTAIGEPAGLEAYVDSIAQTARQLNSASLFAAGRVPLVSARGAPTSAGSSRVSVVTASASGADSSTKRPLPDPRPRHLLAHLALRRARDPDGATIAAGVGVVS